MSEINLKPCPICGEPVGKYTAGFRGPVCTELEVYCGNCFTKFVVHCPSYQIPFDAIERWNRRTIKED